MALFAAEAVARQMASPGREALDIAQQMMADQEAREAKAASKLAADSYTLSKTSTEPFHIETQARNSQHNQGDQQIMSVRETASLPCALEPPSLLPYSELDVADHAQMQQIQSDLEALRVQLQIIDRNIEGMAHQSLSAPSDQCGYGGFCQARLKSNAGHMSGNETVANGRIHNSDSEVAAFGTTANDAHVTRNCIVHGNWRVNKPLELHRQRQQVLLKMHDLATASHVTHARMMSRRQMSAPSQTSSLHG